MANNIYRELRSFKQSGQKGLVVLIDPDSVQHTHQLGQMLHLCVEQKVDYIFIGGSLITSSNFDDVVHYVKDNCNIPLILFPGNNMQINSKADGILFLSLISGRNPEFLIGQHVVSAPILRKSNLEVISTGYILIGTGRETTVSYISNTKAIPADKPAVASATALAGEMLGMKMIYLEAGSGAEHPIPSPLIAKVRRSVDLPLIVGGGIRDAYQAEKAYEAGADLIVIGNITEKDPAAVSEIAEMKIRYNQQSLNIHQ